MSDDTTPTDPRPPEPKRLTRSGSDAVIGGVASGLGRYFGLDPLLFRIGFVALSFAGGIGLVAYLLLLVFVPTDGTERRAAAAGPPRWPARSCSGSRSSRFSVLLSSSSAPGCSSSPWSAWQVSCSGERSEEASRATRRVSPAASPSSASSPSRWRAPRWALALVLDAEPDVVLLDVRMPGGGGVEVIRQVAARRPGQRFLALSVSDAPDDVIAVIRAGARGYVTKTISGEELADAVRRVADGDAVFSPRLAGFVLDAFAGGLPEREVDPQLDQLSPRERKVLRHIARGYLYREIAQRLSISTKTVEAHVSAVLRKLQLSNRHELSRWAVERRLID
jgi:DNA-binding NarL/FixJ family response regulator/phage shock protein PspC (stress-responsive transcriptional regulator)